MPPGTATVAHAKSVSSSLAEAASRPYQLEAALALSGSLLMWASLPPLQWHALAWLAPVPWLLLVRKRDFRIRRPYRLLWLAGLLFWLGTLHWLRLPHWLTGFGWIALSAYLAVYVPVFILFARLGVHRLGLSIVVVAPVVWTSLEFARAHLLTGFTMSSLGHTQYQILPLIQIADVTGFYGVSFLVVFVASCITRMLPIEQQRASWWPVIPGLFIISGTLGYGFVRLDDVTNRPGPKVALIQGNKDTQFDGVDRRQETLEQHMQLAHSVRQQHDDLDLIVWPESMFPAVLITIGAPESQQMLGSERRRFSRDELQEWRDDSLELVANVAQALDVPLLLNTEGIHFKSDTVERFNTSILVERDGRIANRYDKMHLVLFGEYIPFGSYLPWLYRPPFPLSSGLSAGTEPKAFQAGDSLAAVSICYEIILPHIIRRQVSHLASQGEAPNLLINATNNGWFWGSSELDLHLICSVFRAVECRMPLLIAANTGFSAWIDGSGRVLQRGPRHGRGVIVADVKLDSRSSLYLAWGDWFAVVCTIMTTVFCAAGVWRRPPTARP